MERLETLIGTLTTEVKDLKNAMEFMNSKFEECMTELREAKRDKEVLTTTVKAMENKIKILEDKVMANDIQLREDKLEIAGVPVSPNEDCKEIALQVAKKANPNLQPTDVIQAFRIGRMKNTDGNMNTNRPILVQYRCPQTRNTVFKNKKALRGVDTLMMGLANEKKNIYINEHLSGDMKFLLRQANIVRKEKEWRFLWTNGGVIHVRKSESSRVILIKRQEDLNFII